MSIPEKNDKFYRKYLAQTDNVFEAINKWTADSNKIYTKYQGLLNNVEALNAALTSKLPDNLKYRIPVKLSSDIYVFKYIRESLNYVDDILVKQSVLISMRNSISKNCLVVTYVGRLTEGQKARIRILCNMLWYTLTVERN